MCIQIVWCVTLHGILVAAKVDAVCVALSNAQPGSQSPLQCVVVMVTMEEAGSDYGHWCK